MDPVDVAQLESIGIRPFVRTELSDNLPKASDPPAAKKMRRRRRRYRSIPLSRNPVYRAVLTMFEQTSIREWQGTAEQLRMQLMRYHDGSPGYPKGDHILSRWLNACTKALAREGVLVTRKMKDGKVQLSLRKEGTSVKIRPVAEGPDYNAILEQERAKLKKQEQIVAALEILVSQLSS